MIESATRVQLEVVLLDPGMTRRARVLDPGDGELGLESLGEMVPYTSDGASPRPVNPQRSARRPGMPWNAERPGYRLRMVAPSSAGVHVFAGSSTRRVHGRGPSLAPGAPPSLATATAVLIVPHVPCEWTLGRTVVAPPIREPTS